MAHAIEPNHIYTLQPGTLLTIANGRLQVRPVNAAHRERNPIDIFLASLADDRGDGAVGIILSGSGSDGTLGVKAIKEHGGFTIAQGPDGIQRHPGMPDSAIATGFVDLVLPVEKMAAALVDYVQTAAPLGDLTDDREMRENARVEEARRAITTILRNQIGHDFRGYKHNTFLRRVQRRMQALRLTDIEDYVQHLRQDRVEAALLFRDLLIGVTNFFRDADAFQVLEKEVIPQLFEGRGAGDAVRVWVPGCATGEEVYSIAMLLARACANPPCPAEDPGVRHRHRRTRPGRGAHRPISRQPSRAMSRPTGSGVTSSRTAPAASCARRSGICASSRRTA